jgi:tetratricopeptide (TPR) repeat protein
MPMKVRTLRNSLLLFLCGLVALSFGVLGFAYDHVLKSGIESFKEGKSFTASKIFEHLANLPFSDPRASFNRGIALLDLSPDDAMAAFRKFIADTNDPKLKAEGYYFLSWSIVASGNAVRYGEALGYLAEAMRLDTSHKGAKNLYERLNHFQKNRAPKDESIRPDPATQFGRSGEEPKP